MRTGPRAPLPVTGVTASSVATERVSNAPEGVRGGPPSALRGKLLDREVPVGYGPVGTVRLRGHVEATSGPDGTWAMSLTGAELRLLPYLATHLTFPGIATRLFISRNTVKSEAISIYRKLGVSSRSDAIERAVEVGLLEDSIYPRPSNLIPEG